jgi:flagellar basal-body rod modification protein FlgD
MSIIPMTTGFAQAHSAATTRTNNSKATTPDQAANNAEQTFLSLLVTELKSQDPTSPMDPTQMVGQMLSMNQLNELIAINQTLQNALGGAAASAAQQSTSSSTSLPGGSH